MRIAFFVVGTYGDALPVAALGRALAARGHEVVVATSHDHRGVVEAQGLRWSALSPSYADEIAAARDRLGGSQATGAALLRGRMVEAARRWPAEVAEAAAGAGLLVGAGTAMGAVAAAAGERFRIPVAHAHVMPLTPTRHYPPPLPPPSARPLPGIANLLLWRTMRLLVWRACFAEAVGALRAAWNLPALPFGGPSATARGREIPVLYNWSPHLMPPPPDWPRARIRLTGAWLPPPPPGGEALAPALEAFLAAGETPLYAGFGSMRVAPAQRDALARTLADALALTGRRAVLGEGWRPAPGADHAPLPPERVLVVRHAPFGALLPRVSAAIHHGGAGTLGLAARAGIPQVIVPFVIDQFFWAWQLPRLGVAPPRLPPRRRLDAETLARAIDATEAPPMRDAAARLGAAIAAEDGVASAIAALREWRLLPD